MFGRKQERKRAKNGTTFCADSDEPTGRRLAIMVLAVVVVLAAAHLSEIKPPREESAAKSGREREGECVCACVLHYCVALFAPLSLFSGPPAEKAPGDFVALHCRIEKCASRGWARSWRDKWRWRRTKGRSKWRKIVPDDPLNVWCGSRALFAHVSLRWAGGERAPLVRSSVGR